MPSDELPIAISIIVPCWRGDAVSTETAARWLQYPAVREVIVATVGESTAAKGEPNGFRTVHCSRQGRGNQMNEATRAATGSVFLFHHADTELTAAHLESLETALRTDPSLGGGAFRRRFDERHPHLRWIEPWEALRCRRFGPLFGDQSLFVRRSAFNALGGFADIPLMEDVDFSCRLRRQYRVTLLLPAIRSSARKHIQQGRWRTTLINALFLLLYVCGISPRILHSWYYRNASEGAKKAPDRAGRGCLDPEPTKAIPDSI
jgi:rSAM/selenodomain-associated transferase 2